MVIILGISMIFLIFFVLFFVNKIDERTEKSAKTTEERLHIMEMRLNALLEKIGGDDENMGI